MKKREQRGDHEDIHQGDFEEEDPAQSHQLIPAKPGQGPADPNKKEQNKRHLGKKRNDVEQSPEHTAPARS